MTSTIARAHDRKPPSNTPMQPTASREIVRILAVCVARSLRLMGRPFGGCQEHLY
jgi:hypothetical protein